jgi:hypothetical protein
VGKIAETSIVVIRLNRLVGNNGLFPFSVTD